MELLNNLIIIIGVFACGTLVVAGAVIGFAIAFQSRWDFSDRWYALLPMALGSGLAILGLALAKWAIAVL